VSKTSQPDLPKKLLSGFLELLQDIDGCQCLHNKHIYGLVQQTYRAYTVWIWVDERVWGKLSDAVHNLFAYLSGGMHL